MNVSTDRFVTIDSGSQVLLGGLMKDEECMFRDCLKDELSLSFLVITTFSFAILHIMTTSRSYTTVVKIAPVQELKKCYQH